MFEKRLTWFWILLTAIAALIVGRLAQVQVVSAAEYDALAERLLTRSPDYVTAPRGTIRDRNGVPLVSDEPTFDVCVHFAVLSRPLDPERRYLARIAEAARARGDYPEDMRLAQIADHLRDEKLPWMWERLSELTGWPVDELWRRADDVRAGVERVKAAVRRSNPTVREIAEERQRLPLIEEISSHVALSVRLELEREGWLRVQPGARRVAHDADALVHVLGRLGAASPERIANDPLSAEELRGLRAGDRCGVSGVERLGENALRGSRGRVVRSIDGTELERTDPIPGEDIYLTLDASLQREVLRQLTWAVEGKPAEGGSNKREGGLPARFRAGAAAAVIDVASREILALASYPTYQYAYFNVDYRRLSRDRRRLPLRFRAIQEQYAPGSTCKVITLLAGLSEGVITPQTRFHCTGHLLPDKPNIFRCWIFNQHPGWTHDMLDDEAGQNAVSAVRNSCNIYFFKVGGLLGPGRLCAWFQRCGLGQTQGTGLIEEATGIVPTEAWLADPRRANPRAYRKSDAWNFAIGQGEVTATPLQAANVAATVASGYWAPVRLAYDADGHALGEDPVPERSFEQRFMAVARQGMWEVVNHQGGTARRARLDSEDYEICGKTGSAQTVRRVMRKRYTLEWEDGRRESVIATSQREALAPYGRDKPRVVNSAIYELFPALEEGEKLPAHAWFIGFTQPKTTARGGVPQGKVYAIAVLVEYGGSGGRVAAPVAREIAEYLLRGTP
jgi:cell division protein FtsI/penicillin-binding protein 2